MRLSSIGLLIVLTPLSASASLIGDTISVDRIIPSGPYSPYSFAQNTLGLPGPIQVVVAAGKGDSVALTTGNNLFADVEESSILIDFGPQGGSGGPTLIHLIKFTDLDWLGSPGIITGFTFDTDLTGMDASRISFTEDSVSVDISQIGFSGGQFLRIGLEITQAPVPEPTTLAIWGTLGGLFGLIGARRRKRVA